MIHIQSALGISGTPCYVYDQRKIRSNIGQFSKISYGHKSIHFASMANNNATLLRLLKESSIGVFVNSMKHLAIALNSGFGPEDIIYATTGMSADDVRFLASKRIRLHLDSLQQVDIYGSHAPGRSVGVRLNIAERSKDNVLSAPESRIGMDRNDFPLLLARAAKYSLKIVGAHVYLGTNITSVDTMIEGTRHTLDMAMEFPDLEYVDLGSGFPVDDDGRMAFDYQSYADRITALFAEYSRLRGRPISLILEPGRALFGDTAVFCTKVIDVKERAGRRFVCCDASISLLPRSIFYGTYHPVSVLGKEDDTPYESPTDVVGSTTYSRDYLAKSVSLPKLEIGDVLVFKNAGSYCYSMMSHFLGQPWPAEVLVDDELVPRIIREREVVEVHA